MVLLSCFRAKKKKKEFLSLIDILKYLQVE